MVNKELLTLAERLEKEAAEKKPDLKARIRNRGDVVFPAESPKVSDHKDHFELNSITQARAALSYAGHFDKAPPWYRGSLEELKSAIRRKVKAKYPSIDVSEPKKKKAMVILSHSDLTPTLETVMANDKLTELCDTFYEIVREVNKTASPKTSAKVLQALTGKYGQVLSPTNAPKQDLTNAFNAALAPYGYTVLPGTKAEVLDGNYVDVKVQGKENAKFKGQGIAESDSIKNLLNPVSLELTGLKSRPLIYT